MGNWPTAGPWFHTTMFSLFDEKSEEGGQKRCRECGLQVQMSENTSKRPHSVFLFRSYQLGETEMKDFTTLPPAARQNKYILEKLS